MRALCRWCTDKANTLNTKLLAAQKILKLIYCFIHKHAFKIFLMKVLLENVMAPTEKDSAAYSLQRAQL